MGTNYNLEEEFEDYVYKVLWDHGIATLLFRGKTNQLKGENLAGIEIKHDMQAKTTGNLYIEISEKSDPANAEYYPSGIYRDDNTWLYLIGDYDFPLFIFSKTMLKLLEKQKWAIPKQKPTSNGFLIPIVKARQYAALIL